MGFNKNTIILLIQAAFTIYFFVDDVSAGQAVKELKEYNPKEFQQAVLEEVNRRRARHHVPPLYISDEITDRAMKCARLYADTKSIATKCPWRGSTGENSHFLDPGNAKSNYTAFAVQTVAETWYSEITKMDYKNPTINKGSRLVWKGIRELGFGMALGGDTKGPKYLALSLLVYPDTLKKETAKDNIFQPL